MNGSNHMSTTYFDEMYRSDPDPWGFDRRWFERRKYALCLAALPEERYRRGLEPGCANGALTELLGSRCDELIAYELMAEPAARARTRLALQPHVTVVNADLPNYVPQGTGDLLVWSEVGYYLTDEGLSKGLDGIERWLEAGGTMLACHYTGPTNYPQTAATVHDAISALDFLRLQTTLHDPDFRIDVWQRA